jgi:hypothetical protein
MSKTFTTQLPPTDAEARMVVVHYHTMNKPHATMSIKEAADLGLLRYTTDARGYVESITSMEGEPGCPGRPGVAEDVKAVRPTGYGAGNKPWVCV